MVKRSCPYCGKYVEIKVNLEESKQPKNYKEREEELKK